MVKWWIASLIALCALPCHGELDGTVLGVHGSGTTNPSKCYWLIMEQIKERAKWPIHLTYRAVGSGTGQAEFIGTTSMDTPDNDFGSGDIPISTEDYNALTSAGHEVLHLPIVLGAISLFHSVPGVSREDGLGLNLTACLISRIFKRDITNWDHKDVVALNPGLDLPSKPYPINVAHRVKGSSSTASVTEYLHQTCPDEWPAEMVGKEITWPDDTEGCEGSAGMTSCILKTPGTIGYIDSGHGHEENLHEIELQNADGNYLSSKEASKRGGIAAAAGAVPSSADQDFGSVNLLNRPGPNTWPIVAMSYVYVRRDLSHLKHPQEQTLLKAFLRSLYDPAVIHQCEKQFGFTAVPDEVRTLGLDGIASLEVTGNATEWVFENSTENGAGQGPYVISLKRRTYGEYQRSGLSTDVQQLQNQVFKLKQELEKVTGEVVELDGSPQQSAQASSANEYREYTQDDEDRIQAALAMSAISIAFWGIAIIAFGAKYCMGL